eukprot:GHVS01045476.1.p1 GENE.GHVS01045476.1~~GHVS01045476.1.p1  ORF type:complete len:537 (+),score=84.18 GHVS01045476.1:66-1676(+)
MGGEEGHEEEDVEGRQEEVYANGDWYKGPCKNGWRHGWGVYMHRVDKAQYKGEWWQGVRHGYGWYQTVGGSGAGLLLAGQWQADRMHGFGVCFIGDSRYEGTFRKGTWHGMGMFVCPLYSFVGRFHHGRPTTGVFVANQPAAPYSASAQVPVPTAVRHPLSPPSTASCPPPSLMGVGEVENEKRRRRVREWSKAEVKEFLVCVGLSDCSEAFYQEGIDGEELLMLTASNMLDWIPSFAHIQLLLQAIALLTKSEGPEDPPDLCSSATDDIPWADLAPIKSIGQGGFGCVDVYHYQGLLVAAKRYRPDRSSKEFSNEVELLRKLRHPNIVLFIGCNIQQRAVIMEYVDGGSLLDHLQRSALSIPQIIKIATGVCSACTYMWQRHRICHGDLKSSNILIDANFNPKICDFGLAVEFSPSGRSSLHPTHDRVGTAQWMAPEALSGSCCAGTKCDVYSFGVLLLEMAQRAPPFGDVPVHVVLATVGWAHARPPIDPSVSLALREIITACFQPSHQLRPSFSELTQAFLCYPLGQSTQNML